MKKLLVVDDNQGMLEILSISLKHYFDDLVILTAKNGKEAVKILETMLVDLIVTDLQMPVMDGYALTRFRNREYPHIPIIGMTSDLNPLVETKLESLGVKKYLAKPFDVQQMVNVISGELGGEEYGAAT